MPFHESLGSTSEAGKILRKERSEPREHDPFRFCTVYRTNSSLYYVDPENKLLAIVSLEGKNNHSTNGGDSIGFFLLGTSERVSQIDVPKVDEVPRVGDRLFFVKDSQRARMALLKEGGEIGPCRITGVVQEIKLPLVSFEIDPSKDTVFYTRNTAYIVRGDTCVDVRDKDLHPATGDIRRQRVVGCRVREEVNKDTGTSLVFSFPESPDKDFVISSPIQSVTRPMDEEK